MRDDEMDFQPVIIIGAARSGTNMLREILTQLPGVGTWPCDEINYLWRHRNSGFPDDELTAAQATPRVVQYIRGQFRKMADSTESRWLIEKTCANSLRVDFVHAVVPEAKYLFIVRDGRDVVLSATNRWKASLNLRYVLKKVPFVPLTDIPYYAVRYLGHHLHRLYSNEGRLLTWGPRFAGMREMLMETPLDEVCAVQWQKSTVKAKLALSQLASDRVHLLSYENVVQQPQPALEAVLRFLGIDASSADRERIVQSVFTDSVGVWRTKMSEEQRQRIESRIGDTLRELGYETDAMARLPRAA